MCTKPLNLFCSLTKTSYLEYLFQNASFKDHIKTLSEQLLSSQRELDSEREQIIADILQLTTSGWVVIHEKVVHEQTNTGLRRSRSYEVLDSEHSFSVDSALESSYTLDSLRSSQELVHDSEPRSR
jgi:hypothetical protein